MRSTLWRMRSIISFSVVASSSSSSPEPVVGSFSSRCVPEMRRAVRVMPAIGRRLPRTSSVPRPSVAITASGSVQK